MRTSDSQWTIPRPVVAAVGLVMEAGLVAVAGLALAPAGLALAPGNLWAQGQEGPAAETADAQEPSREIRVEILGMSCPFCVYGAKRKLSKLEGVRELDVNLETGLATLTLEEDADVSNDRLRQVIDDAGFEAAAITRNFDSEHPDWKRGERTAGAPSTGGGSP